jgi:hypothetical protein
VARTRTFWIRVITSVEGYVVTVVCYGSLESVLQSIMLREPGKVRQDGAAQSQRSKARTID